MVSAVNEVASNSLRHAGGRGVLRMWHADDTVVCEVSDDGHIDDPLVGRVRPEVDDRGGRGLWMVNQLCELVQVRSSPTGTTVRMHFRSRAPADQGERSPSRGGGTAPWRSCPVGRFPRNTVQRRSFPGISPSTPLGPVRGVAAQE